MNPQFSPRIKKRHCLKPVAFVINSQKELFAAFRWSRFFCSGWCFCWCRFFAGAFCAFARRQLFNGHGPEFFILSHRASGILPQIISSFCDVTFITFWICHEISPIIVVKDEANIYQKISIVNINHVKNLWLYSYLLQIWKGIWKLK